MRAGDLYAIRRLLGHHLKLHAFADKEIELRESRVEHFLRREVRPWVEDRRDEANLSRYAVPSSETASLEEIAELIRSTLSLWMRSSVSPSPSYSSSYFGSNSDRSSRNIERERSPRRFVSPPVSKGSSRGHSESDPFALSKEERQKVERRHSQQSYYQQQGRRAPSSTNNGNVLPKSQQRNEGLNRQQHKVASSGSFEQRSNRPNSSSSSSSSGSSST